MDEHSVREPSAPLPPAPHGGASTAADARRIPAPLETKSACPPGTLPSPRPQSRSNNTRTHAALAAAELMSRIDTHDMAMQVPIRGTQGILDLHYHQRMCVSHGTHLFSQHDHSKHFAN